MKHLLAIAFITLLALGTGCAWISPSSQTTSDGIQVHGHWTLKVSNPDGSVDAVHEFDNALFSTGGSALISLLLGENTIDKFFITLRPSTNKFDFGCKEQSYPDSGHSTLIALPAEAYRDVALDNSGNKLSDLAVISAYCTIDFDTEELSLKQDKEISGYSVSLGDHDKCFKTYYKSIEDYYPNCDITFVLGGVQAPWGAGYTHLTEAYEPIIKVKNKQKLVITVKISFS